MTPGKDIRGEIDRDERWLDEVAGRSNGGDHASEGPSTDLIKRRVRVALGEHWLDGVMADSEPALPSGLRDRVKQRVWAECGQAGTAEPAPRRWAKWMRLGLSVAAAVVVFAFVSRVMWTVSEPDGRGVSGVVVRATAVEILLASLGTPPCDDDVKLSMLEHDIRIMELTVLEPAGRASDDEELMDDLFYDESERLLAELEADLG